MCLSVRERQSREGLVAEPIDTSAQETVLKEVLGAYRYELTEFEAGVWLNIMRSVPRERFVAFLRHHYQTSPFAPKPSDATKHLDSSLSSERAFHRLGVAVAQIGPYADPQISDPILRQAIHLLGGWAAVNEQMPAASETHATRAFRERFDASFNMAVTQVRIDQIEQPDPLIAIGMGAGAPSRPELPTPKC